MTTPPPPGPPSPPDAPLLSQRAVVVLLTAAFIGAVFGVLTFFSTGNAAGALLAGLTGTGASTLGLHKIIG
ncbi:shikimate kinase [Streptomyces turgidiscabies]|uniref:Shikimate kinase n=1 Tax=Streptomyces turgidiscabies TaxID=85558 RepID=A0ABU0RSX1_9ACTN|nr:shikimate kinase [Streptomyces turgidiscabies]